LEIIDMRARLRLLVVALILLVLGAGGVLLARGFAGRGEADLERQALDLLPEVAQRIVDFRRVKVDGGRKVWEVSAAEARYFDNEELVVVREPAVMIFLEDGRVLKLGGREGRVYLGGQDLRRVEIQGAIHVEFGQYAMEGEYAHYDREQDVVTAPGQVEISGEGISIRGEKLELEVSSQRLRLSKGVEMTWQPPS
jgi:LPS export ABC transporter protein LptC